MGSFFKMNGSHAGPSPSSGPPSMIPQHSSIGDRGFYRKDRDDFWEALSSHYDYLMDDQLVTTCRELEADFSQHSLCPDEGMSSLGSSLPSLPLAGCPPSLSALPPFVQGGSLVGLTPRQLLSRLAELRDWLQEMDTRLEIEDDPDRKKHIIKWSYQELSTYGDCKDRLLREAHMMTSTSALIGGELRAEISAKAEEVSEMWCAKENACSLPQESVDSLDKDKLFHDVTTDMRCLRRWLRDLELRLPAPKTVPPYWTLHDLKTKLENQKIIQHEIESKGILVKSLLKRSDQLLLLEREQFAVAKTGSPESPQHLVEKKSLATCTATSCRTTSLQQQQLTSVLNQPRPANAQVGFDVNRVARIAANLERRWHSLWIRSLEWQCFFEQLVGTQERQESGQHQDKDAESPSVSSNETWDEPKSKQPRLDLTLILPPDIEHHIIESHQREYRSTKLSTIENLGANQINMSVSAPKMDNISVAQNKQMQHSKKHKQSHPQQVAMALAVGAVSHPEAGSHSPQTKLNKRPPSGNYEGGQDVGYSSESSTQLSAEDKAGPDELMRFYPFGTVNGSADTTPESPEMPSRDSGLSGGGSPRKYFPLSAKCSPIDDIDPDDDQVLKDVLDEDYVASSTMRLSGSAQEFYTLTSTALDSDAENVARHDDSQKQLQEQLLEETLTPEKDPSSEVDRPSENQLGHSVTIDDQVVQLRRKPSASRHFAPLDFGNSTTSIDNGSGKVNRVQEWLQSCEVRAAEQKITEELAAEDQDQPDNSLDRTEQDSCDASGELTNESSSSSSSSSSSDSENETGGDADERLKSTTTLNAGSVETLATVAAATTPTDSEAPSKVVNLRSGKKRRSRDRPWSVTEMPQTAITTAVQLPTSMSRSFTAATSSGTCMTQSTLMSTSPTGCLIEAATERRRHSRASKTKTGSNASSGSDSEVSGDGTGVSAKRNSSTTSLINLCEPAKDKATPVRRRRLGSKALSKSNLASNRSSHSSANDNMQDPQSDTNKKSDIGIVAGEVLEAIVGDQGSVISSDNMWDDYQDHYSEHYLDHYSEKEMDDDTVRRLLNFGDDYRSFIGSTSDTSSLSGLRVRGGGHKKGHTDDRRYRGAGRDSELDSEQEQMQQLNSLGHDESNSNNISCDNKMDIDAVTAVSRDHTHAHTVPALLTSSGQIGLDVGLKNLENSTQVAEVLNRSDRDLAFVTNALNKDLLSKDAMTANQFNEMIAKCRSNIQCLQIIKINISIGPDQPSSCSLSGNTTISGVYGPGNLAPSTEQLIRQLMERWNMLLLDIQSRGATNPNEESRSPVLANGAGANNVSNQCAPLICTPFRRTFDDESVREDIVKLREEMLQMECMQRELEDESVNLQRLNVNKLDERIAVLKRNLSTLHELKRSLLNVKVKVHRLAASNSDRVCSLTQDVRDLYNTWDTLYESTKHQLMNLQQSKNFLQDPNRRNNYLSEAFHRQKVTAEAELDGHHQVTDTSENAIDISEIIKISTQMKDSMGGATVADLPLTSLQPRNGICPASATLLQFKVNDDDYDSNYESEDDSPTICSDSEGNKSIWRIFKAALPFQVALVMLYCVACFMEPRCCDVTNTLNSFGPQLRYEQGPPPV